MADPFTDAVNNMVENCPGVIGAAFTDLDGEDIALSPRSEKETLRLCAAYSGIALRRLCTSEQRAGRAPVDHLVLAGSTGALVTMRVASDYQLVISVGPGVPTGRVLSTARKSVELLEANC